MSFQDVAFWWFFGSVAVYGVAITLWVGVALLMNVNELKLRAQGEAVTTVFFFVWMLPIVLPVLLISWPVNVALRMLRR